MHKQHITDISNFFSFKNHCKNLDYWDSQYQGVSKSPKAQFLSHISHKVTKYTSFIMFIDTTLLIIILECI